MGYSVIVVADTPSNRPPASSYVYYVTTELAVFDVWKYLLRWAFDVSIKTLIEMQCTFRELAMSRLISNLKKYGFRGNFFLIIKYLRDNVYTDISIWQPTPKMQMINVHQSVCLHFLPSLSWGLLLLT